jgi:hypothetical protein
MPKYYNKVQGEWYYDTLRRFHERLQPKTYLEIGSRTGDSVAIAQCSTIAIDPEFNIAANVLAGKHSCHFYQTTSDEFFKARDPKAIFGGPIELAFLDGMHRAEYLLRDFSNTERHCRRNSVIILHDCFPGEMEIASREQFDPIREQAEHPGWWTGDVWKIIPVLLKYRPDLKIINVDSQPTGLVCITNLDPMSDVIERSYAEIVDKIISCYGEAEFNEFWESVDIVEGAQPSSWEKIWSHFWL